MKTKLIAAAIAITAAITAACSFGVPHGVRASVLSPNVSISMPRLPAGSIGWKGPVVGVNLYAVANYSAGQTRTYGERMLAYIKDTLHANAVDLVWNMYSPGYTSNSVVTRPSTTLGPADIAILTKLAQADGLYVEYRPLLFVETKGNTWEGLIEPSNPAAWFDSYYQRNLPYLKLAQRYHITEYVIGTEMKRLTPATQWKSFLARSGRIFRGQISYAQNQYVYFRPNTELPPTTLTGVDMYEPLTNLSPWAPLTQVEAAYDKFFAGMPPSVLRRSAIQETGIEARMGAYQAPPNLTLTGPLDETIQYDWFTAGCQAVRLFHLRGIYFWKADLADNPAEPADSLSTWEGRLGAEAISRCASIIKG